MELGYATDTHDYVAENPRLLRSLSWRDDDYGANILRAIEYILDRDVGNLAAFLEQPRTAEWLKSHDPSVYNLAIAESASREVSSEDEAHHRHNDSIIVSAVGATSNRCSDRRPLEIPTLIPRSRDFG
jgi:hypothetical protein